MIQIPFYKIRLEVLLFMYDFEDKLSELEEYIETHRNAIDQIKSSQTFKKILEVYLATFFIVFATRKNYTI